MKSFIDPSRQLLFIIAFISAILNGCGGDGDGTSTPSPDAPQSNQSNSLPSEQLELLQGQWLSSCLPQGAASIDSNLTIDQSTYREVGFIYPNQSCTGLSDIIVSDQGTFSIGIEVSNGTFQIDQTTQVTAVTPVTDLGAFALNASALCGITDWATGIARDVTARQASGACFGITSLTSYSIYRVTSDSLTIALPTSTNDGSSPNERPTDLSQSVAYTRPTSSPLDECGLPPGQTGIKICFFIATPTNSESITLKNYAASPVDLTGWTLWDANALSNGAGQKNLNGLQVNVFGLLTIGALPFQINDSGETITLMNPQGEIVHQRRN